jgi:hypothetical protein
MACSRYSNDKNRIEKSNAISTFAGRYTLDVPGPGDNMAFNADPHLRIQKWGANFRENMMDINSDLRGLTRPLNRDLPEINCYKKYSAHSTKISYDETNYVTDDSRATNPAWTYRDIEMNRWEQPFLNPLDKLEKPFYNNLNTRILEKDYFKPQPAKLQLAEPFPNLN